MSRTDAAEHVESERFALRTMLDDAAAWARIGINSMAVGRYKDAAYEIDRLRKELERLRRRHEALQEAVHT